MEFINFRSYQLFKAPSFLYLFQQSSAMERDSLLQKIRLELACKKVRIVNGKQLQHVVYQLYDRGLDDEELRKLPMGIVSEVEYGILYDMLSQKRRGLLLSRIKRKEHQETIEIEDDGDIGYENLRPTGPIVQTKEEINPSIIRVIKDQEAANNPKPSLNIFTSQGNVEKKMVNIFQPLLKGTNEEKCQPRGNLFDYDQSAKINKRVLLVIISKRTMNSIEFIHSHSSKKIEFKNKIYTKNTIITKIPLNFDNLNISLSECSIKIVLSKGMFAFGTDEIILSPLSNHVKWYKCRGVIVYDELQEENILKMAAMFSSSQLYQEEQQYWDQLSRWWYLLKHWYLDEIKAKDTEADLVMIFKSGIMNQKDSVFNKYFIGLVWSIFKDEFWETMKSKEIIRDKITQQNYEFPQSSTQEENFLQLIYLRTLYYGKASPVSKQRLLELNFKHQSYLVKRDMILEASIKELQNCRQIYEAQMLKNQEISITQFLDRYFPLINRIINEKSKNIQNKEKLKEYFDSEVEEVMKLLQTKCKRLDETQKRKEELSELKKRSHLIDDLLYLQNIDDLRTKELKITSKGVLQYMKAAKNIFKFQENVSKWLISLLGLNEYTIKRQLKNNFTEFFYVFLQEPQEQQHLRYMSNYIASNFECLEKLLEFPNQNQLKEIVQFYKKYLSPYHEAKSQFMLKFKQIILKKCQYEPQNLDYKNFLKLLKEQSNSEVKVESPFESKIYVHQVVSLLQIEQVHQVYCEVIVAVVSQEAYNQIKNRTISYPFSVVKMDDISLSYVHLKNINTNDLLRNCFEIIGSRRMVIKTNDIKIANGLGVVWEEIGYIQSNERVLAILHTIQSISKMDQYRLWSSIFIESVKDKNLTFSDLRQEIEKYFSKSPKITIRYLIVIFLLVDRYFPENALSLTENQIIVKTEFQTRPDYQFLKDSDVEKQRKIAKGLFFLFLKAFLHDNQSVSLPLVAKLLDINMVNQERDQVKKEIILSLFKPEYQSRPVIKNFLVEREFKLNGWLIDNRQISNLQFCKIKLFYLLNRIESKRQGTHEDLLTSFFNELSKKCAQENLQVDEVRFEISDNLLQGIFYSKIGFYTVFQNSPYKKVNSENKYKFVYEDSKAFLRFHQKLKSVPDQNIIQIFFSYLKPIILKKMPESLKLFFKESMKAMMSSSLREEERQILTEFIQKNRVDYTQIVEILQVYFENKKIEENYLKDLIQKIQLKNPEMPLFKDIGKIEQLSNRLKRDDQKRLLQIFGFLLNGLKIEEKDFGQYFSSTSNLQNYEIRAPYASKICESFDFINKLNPNRQQKLFDYLSKSFQFQKNKEILQFIIDTYFNFFDAQELTQKQRTQEFWKALLTAPGHLSLLRLKYKQVFNNLIEQFLDCLQTHSYLKSQIQIIFRNREMIVKHLQDEEMKKEIRIKLQNIIIEQYHFTEQITKKLDNLQAIFKEIEVLVTESEKISGIKQNIENGYKLQELARIVNNYTEVAEISEEIKYFKTLPSWSFEKIKNYENLRSQYEKCKTKIVQLAENIDRISFNEFKTYFLQLNIPGVQAIFKSNPSLCIRLNFLIEKLNQKSLKELELAFSSLLYFKSCLKGEKIGYEKILLHQFQIIARKIEDLEDVELKNVEKVAFNVTTSLRQAMKIFDWNSDAKINIIRTTFQCRQLFEKIDQTQIGAQKLKKLKAFSNEIQNCIVKPDIVREFQSVVEYWRKIKSCKTFTEATKQIENSMKINAQFKLDKNIENTYNYMNMLFQKLDEAHDLTNSFKNSIEKLLKKSTVKIVEDSNDLEVIAQIPGFQNKEVLNFAKLNNFKEKSYLQVYNGNDSEDEDQRIGMLKTFCIVFQELECIRATSKQLINYGYDPSGLTCQIQIIDQNFESITLKKEQLDILKEDWVSQIKQIYSRSFLLTHFIGSKLVQFSKAVLSGQYYSSLKDILQMDLESYSKICTIDSNSHKLSNALNDTPINKIKMISEVLDIYQQKMEIQGDHSNKIVLITANPAFFSCQILKENGGFLPLPNQVFYAHEKTVSQQLQFFLYRALINNGNHHFIIGIHRLSENVKSSLCNIIYELKQQRSKAFSQSLLVFIDNQDLNIVYSFLCKPRMFNIEKKMIHKASFQQSQKFNEKLSDQIREAFVVTSAKAGLGKTFYVEMQAKKKNFKIHYFPVCGNIDLKTLGRRLKKIIFDGTEVLLIKVGHVLKKELLNIFLESLVLFRCFFSQEYIYLHKNTIIYIEMENIFVSGSKAGQYIDDSYTILGLLQSNGRQVRLKDFDPRMINFKQAPEEHLFVYTILDQLETRNILNLNLKYYEFHQEMAPNHERKIRLLQKYYLERLKQKSTSFLLYNNLMKMLFFLFETFSNDYILDSNNLLLHLPTYKNFTFQNYRIEFLLICIENTLNLLQEVFTENMFQNRVENPRNFRDVVKEISMLIMPVYLRQAYKFVYFKCDKVPQQLKTLNVLQQPKTNKKLTENATLQQINQICRQYSLQNLRGDDLQKEMFDILYAVSSDVRINNPSVQENQKMLENYVLTRDNFFKMCFLIQRERCGIPCIIEGESGVGKTALITFLSKYIFKNKLRVYNIHAGIHEKELSQMVEDMKIHSQQLHHESFQYDNRDKLHKKLWVFFDEFNTSDELSYIKEMIIEHRFMGKKLPANIHFFAACNPYRKLRPGVKVEAGLRKRSNRSSQLAFMVNSPPLSMIQLMWDYQQLTVQQSESYISNMLKSIDYPKKQALINTMVEIHEKIKKDIEISAISLRDVERVKKLYEWFKQYFINLQKVKNSNYKYNAEDTLQRVVALSLIFCYCIRFSQESNRKQMMALIEKGMKWRTKYCQQILLEQQSRFTKNIIESRKGIAANQALKENIFTIFVCIMNKIPVLLIGNPGSSKSLSVNILASNLNGPNSQKDICKFYPEINMIYFQGSESSTSEGVQEVFKKAESSISQKYSYINCIYFDEIGLAENSSHNPLKVLHSKLELHGQRNFSFIGVSNYELDASKMSRFLILNRSSPTETDLRATAKCIYENSVSLRKTRGSTQHFYEIEQLGTYYNDFINYWNENQPKKSGFFGLRDFYNYVKYVCKRIEQQGNIANLPQSIIQAIQVNFDGQETSCFQFLNILPENKFPPFISTNPIEMIQKNLEDNSSRCLLEIVKGDTLIPYIQRKINHRSAVHYGSAFSQDEKSEEYNYEITNKVMSHMSKGQIIIFKDPNSSIQSSLYDLFNKAFTEYNGKKYCRIAVGANSNPQCLVHQQFNAIVFIEESKIPRLDLPFLNRFEKHYLRIDDLISDDDKSIRMLILQWIEQVLSLEKEDILPRQNFLLNSSEQSINALILKYEELHQSQKLRRIKMDLLKNRTTDFQILRKYKRNSSHIAYQLIQLLENIEPFSQIESDLIIYTYDQYIHLEDNNTDVIKSCYKIKIAEIQSQKQLKNEIKRGLDVNEERKLLIILNYSKDYSFIQQVLYLAKQIKQEQKSKKQIFIIIQLHRFTFVNSSKEELKSINMSYLHQYQQYFLESFEIQSFENIYNEEATYWNLFELLYKQEPDYLRATYTEAISLLKLKFEDKMKENQKIYFEQLNKLGENSSYLDVVNDFVKEVLQNDKMVLDYRLFQNDRDEIKRCSNIYEAIKTIINSISKKVIVVFLKFILSKRYILIFSQRISKLELNDSVDSRILIKFIEAEMKEELRKLKQSIFDYGIDYFKQIKQEKESNEVLIAQLQGSFSLFEVLKQIEKDQKMFKQSLKNMEIDPKQIDPAFSQAYYLNIFKSEQVKQLFTTSQLSHYLLSDIIRYVSASKLEKEHLDFISKFLNEKISPMQLQVKVYLLLCGDKEFWNQLFSILSIFLNYSLIDRIPFIKLTTLNAIQNQQKIGTKIFEVALSLCKMQKQTISFFNSTKDYVRYFRIIFEKVNVFNKFGFCQLVEAQIYLTSKFIELFEKRNEEIPEDFIRFGSQRSIYEKIYQFVQNEIANGKKEEEYQKFLSYSFFQTWITHIIQHNLCSELSKCISQFVNLCNSNSSFASRAVTFFKCIYHYDDEQEIEFEKSINQKSQINKQIERHIKLQGHFTISLVNYFYQVAQEMMQKHSKNVSGSPLTVFYAKFEEYLTKTDSIKQIKDVFKVSFMKHYLAVYLNNLQHGRQRQISKKIDQLLNQRNTLNSEIFNYMLLLLRNKYSTVEIYENFIKITRCEWINEVKDQIEGRIVQKSRPRYQYLFKNIQSVMIEGASYKESIYMHLKKNPSLEGQHSIIHYLMNNRSDDKTLNDGKYLQYFNFIFKFISKIRNLCNLKIKKYEKLNYKILQFIKEAAKNEQEFKKLELYLTNFVNLVKELSKKLELNQNGFQISVNSPLNCFICTNEQQSANQQSQSFTTLIELIAKKYNQICENVNERVRKVDPQRRIIKNQARIDPFSVSEETKFLIFPELDDFYALIQKYSHYSVVGDRSTIEYSLPEIQQKLIDKIQNIQLLFQHRDSFSQPQYIGDNSHFLIEMKSLSTNQSLQQIRKKIDIEQYFKHQRQVKGQIYYKTVKNLQRNLEIIMIFSKNLQCDPRTTIGELIETHLSHLSNQLKEQPFKSINCSALVDLYEFVEFLTFENIVPMLHESYGNKEIHFLKRQQFNDLLQQLKNSSSNGYPSEIQFKKALYRFVGRTVLSENPHPQEIIGEHLCNNTFYWDQNLTKQNWTTIRSKEFRSALELGLSCLSWVLNQVPYQPQIIIEEPIFEFVSEKKKSKNYRLSL